MIINGFLCFLNTGLPTQLTRKGLFSTTVRSIYVYPTAEERYQISSHKIDRFKALRSIGINPNVSSYKDLMLFCMIQQQDDLLKLLWNDMFANGIEPDWELFAVALGSCMPGKKAGRALSYFSEMKKNDVFPMKAHLRAMAVIMEDAGSKEGARIFKGLLESYDKLTWEGIDEAISTLQQHPDFEAYKLFPPKIANPLGIPQYEVGVSK